MVPVELRVSNFLSYGADTPPLDFEAFHVACLSGKNGQGKSALLDAITWALWGEARKSSGSHKPDEELLRIGASRMRVELVFDLEGTRYRVMRGYSRSASGKTSKPELELHILDRAGEAAKPLTRPSVRETQELLDNLIGLDYTTFINSAFLLQGRSDEFTKKRPNERKEILARILNLEKYDRLAALAKDKERALTEAFDRRTEEIGRLTESLAGEPPCRDELAALLGEIATETQALRAAEVDEAEQLRRLAELERQAREEENIRETMRRLDDEAAHHREFAGGLDVQIAAAHAIIARGPAIESAYKEGQRLHAERDALDEKRSRYHEAEQRIATTSARIQELSMSLAARATAADTEQKRLEELLVNLRTQLAERPALAERIAATRAQAEHLDTWLDHVERRRRLQTEIERLERALIGLRESLLGEQRELSRQMKQRKALQEERRRWVQERDRLIEANGRKKSLDTRLDAWTREGQELAEALREGEGRIDAVAAEIERLSEQCRRMEEAAAGACPTCGQILTGEHRAQVLGQLEAERDERIRAREAVQADCRGLAAQREALRERYRAARSEAESLGPIAEALAGVEAQGQALEERIRESEAIEDRLAVVGETLRREAFGERERAALDEALAAREALEIDEQRLDEARAARTQLPWLEERTRTLDGLEEQERDTVETIVRLANEGETLRREIERGAAMTALRVEQADWERRRDEVGFAPQAYEAVRQALRDVAQAGIELRELAEARERLPAWEEQRTRLDERLTTLREEASTLAARLAPMKTLHHALDTQQAQSAASRKKREALSDSLRERAVRNGELNARLERYAREREALETARALRAGIDHERTLYAHLRVAFGKNGIPSLIIEEALPELERRANALLDRLTDGRLHVRLETLKDKKTGGTKETLEIILTDEQGVARPYETYSGGEAFRVNFALRIALSQLLAERQGVRVRTLGIDEGFGTQDEQGIQHMIEAIQAIADDFDKILVITHLDALKEAFPVRIEVEKHPVRGSLFHVVGI